MCPNFGSKILRGLNCAYTWYTSSNSCQSQANSQPTSTDYDLRHRRRPAGEYQKKKKKTSAGTDGLKKKTAETDGNISRDRRKTPVETGGKQTETSAETNAKKHQPMPTEKHRSETDGKTSVETDGKKKHRPRPKEKNQLRRTESIG